MTGLFFVVAFVFVNVFSRILPRIFKGMPVRLTAGFFGLIFLGTLSIFLTHQITAGVYSGSQRIDFVYSLAGFVYLFVCAMMAVSIIVRPGPVLFRWLLVAGVLGSGIASSYYFVLAGFESAVIFDHDLMLIVLSLVSSIIFIWLAAVFALYEYKKKKKLTVKSKAAIAMFITLSMVIVEQIGEKSFSLSSSLPEVSNSMGMVAVGTVTFYMASVPLLMVFLALFILRRLKAKKNVTVESIYPDVLMATGIMLALGFIVFSQWHNAYAHEKEVSLFYIQQQIDRRVSRAHLWLEELRNGSETVEWERDVVENLLLARKYVKASLTGEVVDEIFAYHATDENIIDVLKSIDRDIEKWYQIVAKHREREQNWQNDFYIKLENHVFATMDQNIEQLSAITGRTTQEEWAKVRFVNYITLACLAFLLIGLFAVYHRNKSRMHVAVDDLKSTLKELEFQKTALDEHAIVTVTDRKGNITYSNKKFTEISRYAPDELLGKNHRVLNSNYHSREFFRDLWLTINSGKIWRGSLRNRRKNGEIYWVDTTIVPFLDEKNKPYKFVSIRNDITLVKEAEERQRNLNQELERRVTLRTAELAEINRAVEADREALQLMVEGTSTATGTDFFNLLVKYLAAVLRVKYVIVSEQLYTIPLTGRTIAVRAGDDFVENFEYSLEGTPCEEVVATRGAIFARELNDTYDHIPLFKGIKIESYMGVPMSDSRGRILGHIAVFDGKEFTDKHRLKSIMRIFATRAASELERQHVEEQLRKARDRAVAASRSKSEFLANMSHELRTPMHAILSFASMGREDAESGEREAIKHSFQRIYQSGERLMGLLNDLLDLSKLNAGKMLFEFVESDLAEQVKMMVNEYEAMAASKGVSLEVVTPTFDVRLAFDKERIHQVIRNLISNAIKFTPQGKAIVITFSQSRLMGPEGEVEAVTMAVVDQGVGVPEDERRVIFEQFQQSSRTNRNAGGTGLGLAICKEIVAAHHGEIDVVANPGGGASFQVTLPKVMLGVAEQQA